MASQILNEFGIGGSDGGGFNKSFLKDFDLSDTIKNIKQFLKQLIDLTIIVIKMLVEMIDGLADLKDILIIAVPTIIIARVLIDVSKSFE